MELLHCYDPQHSKQTEQSREASALLTQAGLVDDTTRTPQNDLVGSFASVAQALHNFSNNEDHES